MKRTSIYTPDIAGSYPASLTSEKHWFLMDLQWSEERKKYKKTPISIVTGYAANSDVHGVPFTMALDLMGPDRVVSYRHPDKSPVRLGLIRFATIA